MGYQTGYQPSGTNMLAMVVLIALAVFLGLFAYDEYKEYRVLRAIDEAAAQFKAKEAVRQANNYRMAAAQQEQQRRADLARHGRNLLQSIQGCAANADRTRCTCYDHGSKPVPISTSSCLVVVDEGLQAVRNARLYVD